MNGGLADKCIVLTYFHVNMRRIVSSQKVITKQRTTITNVFPHYSCRKVPNNKKVVTVLISFNYENYNKN